MAGHLVRGTATALLVMAYGTPERPEDLLDFYTHIRRGRPPSTEQFEFLKARYDALGGVSPMAQRTRDQVALLGTFAAELGFAATGRGHKHSAPFIEDGIASLAADGIERVVGVVLAPHFSNGSVGEYHRRAAAAAAEHGVDYRRVDRWWDLDEHIAFQADSLATRLGEMPGAQVVFTAHSLPLRVLEGDPYRNELFDSASAIARRAGLARWGRWGLAWQSAGATPEPWATPDILSVIDDLADTGRSPGLIVVPHGFCSEHLEVVYDIDIEASRRAASLGLALARTDVVGDDAHVMRSLAYRAATFAEANAPT